MLPFPLREGVGGWGIICEPFVLALTGSPANIELAPPPPAPPRKREGRI